MRAQQALGQYGEQLAAEHLVRRGLTILERNWRCSTGELDIIARDGACLVVVEVKTRRGHAFGTPLDAVGPRKVRRLRELALRWLDEQHLHAPEIRFDVIGILQRPGGRPVLEHLIGVA